MRLLCWLGLHRWMVHGGETFRDGRGKLRIQYYICQRHCGVLKMRSKLENV